jgi:aminoacrylate hydrolase
MPIASLGDCDIHYEIHGEGEPVLLVAGLGGAGNYWNPNLAAFSRKYKTVLHDHRGTGRSTHARIKYSIEQMTDDVVRLMDQLKIARAHLVGHSTGGAIGQVMGITHPGRLKSMVLYASWTKSDPFMRRVMEARKTLLLSSGVAAYVNASPIFLYPDWWINANIALLQERDPKSVAAFPPAEIGASRVDAVVAFDRTAELGQIRVPTLVLCAKDDFLTPPYFSEALAKAIPNARLKVLERGGHACSESVPEEFNRAVFEFIDQHA